MSLEQVLAFEDLEANVTLKGLSVINTVNSLQMFTQVALLCKLPAANLALVSPAISAMNSSQMYFQVAFCVNFLPQTSHSYLGPSAL